MAGAPSARRVTDSMDTKGSDPGSDPFEKLRELRMTTMSRRRDRRRLLTAAIGAIALAACDATSGTGPVQDKVLRVGFQKYGTLIPLKTRGTLEEQLKPRGWSVQWKEYPAGP